MQKTFTTSSSNVKHIAIKKVPFTHLLKSIVTEKSIISTLTLLKENSVFNTVLEVVNQVMKKLAQAAIKNIF